MYAATVQSAGIVCTGVQSTYRVVSSRYKGDIVKVSCCVMNVGFVKIDRYVCTRPVGSA